MVTLLGGPRIGANIAESATGTAHAAAGLRTALGVTPDPAPTTWQAHRDRDNRSGSRWPANPVALGMARAGDGRGSPL